MKDEKVYLRKRKRNVFLKAGRKWSQKKARTRGMLSRGYIKIFKKRWHERL